MCGIVGIWHLDASNPVPARLIQQMTQTIRHRGPDDEGYLLVNTESGQWSLRGGDDTAPELGLPHLLASRDGFSRPRPAETGNTSFNLAWGFRRLAILDLSPAGHQPMSNADGSLWLIFNGEIYNYVELRQELTTLGYQFKSGTDTEVILAAYDAWGESCLSRFNGMWAFALWDNRQRKLFCARDRFGIKPFYYIWDGATFVFASEIKALLAWPNLPRKANDGVIHDYLRYNRLDHTEETFFAGVKRLMPAHSLTVQTNQLDIQSYWQLNPYQRLDVVADETEYAQLFYTLFEDAVRIRLRSDVAIGTCLSGGLDSSAIVCTANRLLFGEQDVDSRLVGEKQKTFSSCFEDGRFDERQYIEQVLAATGAEANYTFPTASRLLADLPRLVWHQDEPFGSTSMFAQWCVMEKVAERGVTVLLDGQGADELLAGYQPCYDYYWGGLAKQGQWATLRQELSAYSNLYGSSHSALLLRLMRPHAPVAVQSLARRWKRGGSLGIDAGFATAFRQRHYELVNGNVDPFHEFLYALTHYSYPMLLRFEDRNSMAHSIEARVPYLDYRVVEYLFALPADQKINQGFTKAILRRAFKGILPEGVRTRTNKLGFVTPEAVWLQHELGDFIRQVATSESFRTRGYFDVPQILAALEAHQTGQRDLSDLAWRWVNLELWFRQMIDQ